MLELSLDNARATDALRELGVLGRRAVRVYLPDPHSWVVWMEENGLDWLRTKGITTWSELDNALEVRVSPFHEDERDANETLWHELKHVQQFSGFATRHEAMGEYSYWQRHAGYAGNPFETTAEKYGRKQARKNRANPLLRSA